MRRPQEPRCTLRVWGWRSCGGSRRTCSGRSGRRWSRYRTSSRGSSWSSPAHGTTTWPTMRTRPGRVYRDSRRNMWRSWKKWLNIRTVIIRSSIHCHGSSCKWGHRRNSCFKCGNWIGLRRWRGRGMRWKPWRDKRLSLTLFKQGLRKKRQG